MPDKSKDVKEVLGKNTCRKKTPALWAIERSFVVLRSSCSYRVDGAHNIWKLIEKKKHIIFTFWHRDILGMLSFWSVLLSGLRIKGLSEDDEMALSRLHQMPFSSCTAVMVSASKDGDIVSSFLEEEGFFTIRGSSGSHGLKAAVGTMRYFRSRAGKPACVVMVADGSRGPAGVVQKGIGYMARLTGSLILPSAAFAYPSIRLPSWDKILLPLPFSRIGIAVGSAIDPNQYDDNLTLKIHHALEDLYRRTKIMLG